MEIAESEWAALVGHSSTPSHATRGIKVHAQIEESGIGMFRFVLQGAISRLRIPPAK